MNNLICKQLRNIVYMGVLNTALYYTKVCLGFSSKHEKVDIPQELRPLIWDNLKTEKDFYSGKYRYWLDIWVEPPESEEKA